MIAKLIDKNIRELEPFTVILYKNFDNYEIYYKDVFVFYALFHFSFVRIQNIFYTYFNKSIEIRINRSIQVEGTFGQIKNNMSYDGIRRRGLNKVSAKMNLEMRKAGYHEKK